MNMFMLIAPAAGRRPSLVMLQVKPQRVMSGNALPHDGLFTAAPAFAV